MRVSRLALGLSAGLLLVPAADAREPASPALTPCFDRQEVTRKLRASYGEVPVSYGLQSNGNLLQVYVSAARGTWTMVSTLPSGLACILAVGRNWEGPSPEPAGGSGT